MKLFRSNTKGISPVVGSMLMVVVSVACMILAISYSQGVIDDHSEQLRERLCIEKVFFNTTDNCINIYVRNIGEGELTVEYLLVNGTFYRLPISLTLPQDRLDIFTVIVSFENIDPEGLKPGLYLISLFTLRKNELERVEVTFP